MALSLGATTPTALYLGTTAISAAYLGATQVYTTGGGDAYAIGGASPELVAAFTTQSDGTTAGEYYRKASSETTFSGLFTHSVSGPLTMFDSSGTLVWAPHNLVDDSQTLGSLSLLEVTKSASSIKTIEGVPLYRITDTTANADHRVLDGVGSQPVGSKHTFQFFFEAEDHVYVYIRRFSGGDYSGDWFATINLQTATVVSTTGCAASIVQVGSTSMYRVLVTPDNPFVDTNGSLPFYLSLLDPTGTSAVYTGTETSFLLGGLSIHRSDLGGMADNPDMPAGLEKYVPTTTAAVYGPRRQAYRYNSGWTLAGMQMEAAAATNLYDYGNLLASVWVEIGGTLVDANATLLGTANLASTFTEDTSTGLHRFYDFVPGGGTAGVTYTYSLHLKANGRSKVQVTAGSGSMGTFTHDFDLSAGTAVETSAGTSGQGCGIIDLGSGEYRIYGSWTQVSNGANGPIYALHNGTGTSYTGDGSSGVIAYGAQIETGLIPTSYIPTNGSTVTRAAETLSIAAADLPYSATAMSISMKGRMTYADNGIVVGSGGTGGEVQFYRWTIDANDYIRAALDTSGGRIGRVDFAQEDGGTRDVVSSATDAYSPGINVPFNIASRHGSTFINGAVDGTALTANLTPTALADLSGTAVQLGYTFNGFISEFRMWGTDIGDSGIAEVTSA